MNVSATPTSKGGLLRKILVCLCVACALVALAVLAPPRAAFNAGSISGTSGVELADGNYQAEVALCGGSGRASVTSPTQLTVSDGKATITIEWSSPNYDYMLVAGERYLPISQEGNSVFEIPVLAFDEPFDVVGDTTAMSQPHEIDYQLTVESSSIQATDSAKTPESAQRSRTVAFVVVTGGLALAGGVIFVLRKLR